MKYGCPAHMWPEMEMARRELAIGMAVGGRILKTSKGQTSLSRSIFE